MRSISDAPTRPARTTAMWRGWRCCWPACRKRFRAQPSIASAPPGSMPLAQRAGQAIASGYFAEEITLVSVPGGKAGPISVDKDEHPRPETTLEGLSKLKPIVRNPGTVTAGDASGVNDGAAAMILASEAAVK